MTYKKDFATTSALWRNTQWLFIGWIILMSAIAILPLDFSQDEISYLEKEILLIAVSSMSLGVVSAWLTWRLFRPLIVTPLLWALRINVSQRLLRLCTALLFLQSIGAAVFLISLYGGIEGMLFRAHMFALLLREEGLEIVASLASGSSFLPLYASLAGVPRIWRRFILGVSLVCSALVLRRTVLLWWLLSVIVSAFKGGPKSVRVIVWFCVGLAAMSFVSIIRFKEIPELSPSLFKVVGELRGGWKAALDIYKNGTWAGFFTLDPGEGLKFALPLMRHDYLTVDQQIAMAVFGTYEFGFPASWIGSMLLIGGYVGVAVAAWGVGWLAWTMGSVVRSLAAWRYSGAVSGLTMIYLVGSYEWLRTGDVWHTLAVVWWVGFVLLPVILYNQWRFTKWRSTEG